ncbi:MarR family transcriptional regulator [Staphylococcus argenteus]|nr:MarR family transcriptional regulator [Staphylococcus argenteus]
MAIENDEKLNIKKLGERVFLDSGTLTPLLKKLEKKNYVVRTREEKDERNLQISLTEHGKEIKEPLTEISIKVFKEFNISGPEASDLIQNLRNFVSKNFDNYDKK